MFKKVGYKNNNNLIYIYMAFSTLNSFQSTSFRRKIVGIVIKRVYPPSTLNASPTTLSGQAYGNFTYTMTDNGFAGFPYYPYILPIADNNYCSNGQIYSNNVSGGSSGDTTVSLVSGSPFFTKYINGINGISGTNYSGIWNEIQLSVGQIFVSVTITGRTNYQSPNDFAIFGSNNGTDYILIAQGKGTYTSSATVVTLPLPNNNNYTRYRVAVQTSFLGGNGYMDINGISYST
jgi:hypothetical protein